MPFFHLLKPVGTNKNILRLVKSIPFKARENQTYSFQRMDARLAPGSGDKVFGYLAAAKTDTPNGTLVNGTLVKPAKPQLHQFEPCPFCLPPPWSPASAPRFRQRCRRRSRPAPGRCSRPAQAARAAPAAFSRGQRLVCAWPFLELVLKGSQGESPYLQFFPKRLQALGSQPR